MRTTAHTTPFTSNPAKSDIHTRTTPPNTSTVPNVPSAPTMRHRPVRIAPVAPPNAPAKTGPTITPKGGANAYSTTGRAQHGTRFTQPAQATPTMRPTSYGSTLMDTQKLPGPMSTNLLGNYGALQPLDNICAYLPQYSKSLFGRSAIMANLVPHRTVACGATAAWVWLGGAFPETIDVISSSHYRSATYGRRIRTYNRKATPEQTSTIGGLMLTTPARTACDVILMDENGEDDHAAGHPSGTARPGSSFGLQALENEPEDLRNYRSAARETACALIQEFHFSPEECLAILDANRLWPGAAQASRFFTAIRYCF